MAVRILIADDHDLLRHGLRAVLSGHDGWEVCGEATTGREAVREAMRLKPEIVVMDIGMPELNGLLATRQILKDLPQTEIVILTLYNVDQVLEDVLASGARGLVLKSDADRDLVSAVEALSRHKPFFTSAAAERMLEHYTSGESRPATGAATTLTLREREIVQLVAEGKGNKEIADLLTISVRTAETHRARIMAKLNLRSTGDLVRYAVRHRIIEA